MTDLVAIMTRLVAQTQHLEFGPPVAFAYHPLEYAWPVATAYFDRYGMAPKEILFLGMNPGPFGMGQTGVPFGDVASVRRFLKLSGEIRRPERMHMQRPIEGWECGRSEISGQRFWGALEKKHTTAERFFERAFVLNYCPVLFLSETGANVALDKIDSRARKRLEAICDASLAECIGLLTPKHLVGVGTYAARRLSMVSRRSDVVVMPHPSPASPRANSGWDTAARKALTAAGLGWVI